jgi:succinate dehydrogenase / fumarate reductase, cytochrome b subunit
MVAAAVNHYFRSSIGRKHLVALTGLALCVFLITHLMGNFLLLVSAETFNVYANNLTNLGSLLYVAEGGLLLIFLVHLGLAVKLNIENVRARGGVKRYLKKRNTGRGTTIMSMTMPWTGIVLLVFIILHINALKLGPVYYTTVAGIEMRDMYRTTFEYFSHVGNVIWYCFAMICAAMHTAHGIPSALQSMGWNHGKYWQRVKVIGYIYAVVIGGGFAFVTVWTHLQGA